MKKSNLIMSLISVIFSIALITFMTYAWYINIDTSKDMEFEILQIQSLVSMYEGVDLNHNGLPDKLSNDNVGKYLNPNVGSGTYISYADKYYNETYSFKYLDQRYALARDSESNLLNKIEILDLVSSKIFTYKFEITNLSGKENDVSFGFENDTEVDKTKLKDFQVRCGIISDTGGIDFTSWRDFSDGEGYKGFTITPANLKVEGKTAAYGGGTLEVGRLDVWLEVRQKSDSTLTLSQFNLPDFRLTLSLDTDQKSS